MTSGTSKVEEAVSKFEAKFSKDEKDLESLGYSRSTIAKLAMR